MPAEDERRELVPAMIATIVAAIGAFFLWSDLRNDSLVRGDGMITSTVVSRAGAIVAPSEPPAHLVVQQTVLASEPSTVGRRKYQTPQIVGVGSSREANKVPATAAKAMAPAPSGHAVAIQKNAHMPIATAAASATRRGERGA
jgi:hypothetical protein